MTKLEQITQIIDSNPGNRVMTVSYIKKDGTPRILQMMRSKKLEATVNNYTTASLEKRKMTLSANGMRCVEEITKDKKFQWRTINLNTVTRIAANGRVWTF